MCARRLDHGAFGLSAGMDYEGDFADPDAEVVELLKLVQERDGIFAPHTRNLDYRCRVQDPEDFGYGRSFGPYEDAWVGRFHGVVEAVETATLANKIRTHIAHFPPAWVLFQPHPDELERVMAQGRPWMNMWISRAPKVLISPSTCWRRISLPDRVPPSSIPFLTPCSPCRFG